MPLYRVTYREIIDHHYDIKAETPEIAKALGEFLHDELGKEPDAQDHDLPEFHGVKIKRDSIGWDVVEA